MKNTIILWLENNTLNEFNTFDNFFKGSFCYHWHNRWNDEIQENSIIKQLISIIDNSINTSFS